MLVRRANSVQLWRCAGSAARVQVIPRRGAHHDHHDDHGHGGHGHAEEAVNPDVYTKESFNSSFYRRPAIALVLLYSYLQFTPSDHSWSIRSIYTNINRTVKEVQETQEYRDAYDAEYYRQLVQEGRMRLISQTAQRPALPTPTAFTHSLTRTTPFNIPVGSQVVWDEKNEE